MEPVVNSLGCGGEADLCGHGFDCLPATTGLPADCECGNVTSGTSPAVEIVGSEKILKAENSDLGDCLFYGCYNVLSKEKRAAFRCADLSRAPESGLRDLRVRVRERTEKQKPKQRDRRPKQNVMVSHAGKRRREKRVVVPAASESGMHLQAEELWSRSVSKRSRGSAHAVGVRFTATGDSDDAIKATLHDSAMIIAKPLTVENLAFSIVSVWRIYKFDIVLP